MMVSYAAGDTVAAAFLLLCVSGVMASAVNTVVRLIFGRGGGLCRTLMKRGLTVFIALLFSSIAFPVINTAFPPNRVAVLYVVGDRVLPDFADGDAILTSQHISPIVPGEIVLHKNHSAGGFHFEGLSTPIRLRRVAEASSRASALHHPDCVTADPDACVTLHPTVDNSGETDTGFQTVPRDQIIAKASLKIPYFAKPLRWAQQGSHAVRQLPGMLVEVYRWACYISGTVSGELVLPATQEHNARGLRLDDL